MATIGNNMAAALPLVIALIGGNVSLEDKGPVGTNTRIAVSSLESTIGTESLTENQQSWLSHHNPNGVPIAKYPGHRTLIVRQGYSLAHNNVDLIADWVAYRLTKEFVQGSEERPGTSAFKPDPTLPKGRRAELSDYKGWKGVFDRGHQAASADSKGRGRTVIRESFLLSNMTPQASRLNQVGWRLLEERIQNLAVSMGPLWVVTGPAFVDDDNDGLVQHLVVGGNRVSVPTHYYKVVVNKQSDQGSEIRAMAFLIPNKEMADDFDEYLVSIDQIEELTGFDFLSGLEDSQEVELEASVADSLWE